MAFGPHLKIVSIENAMPYELTQDECEHMLGTRSYSREGNTIKLNLGETNSLEIHSKCIFEIRSGHIFCKGYDTT